MPNPSAAAFLKSAGVIREMKPTFAKPAPPGVMEKIRGADAVIEGLAD